MAIIFNKPVNDQSTAIVTCAFCDGAGEAITPTSVTWTLSDLFGNIVNSRENVSITPAASVSIVLSGNDLKYADGKNRYLLVEALYNSTLGSDLPLKEEAIITITDLAGV